ncbi:MAG: DUF4386 domain-containing protein [Acidimicrobiales bacterium]|jgi:hypothetical protein
MNTNHTLQESDSPTDDTPPINHTSVNAGFLLLALGVISGFSYLFAVKGLVTPGNAVKTARDISAHEGLFRFGCLGLFFAAVLDVIVAWVLFRFFAPVNRALSLAAAWSRTAYAAIFAVAIKQLTSVPDLLSAHGRGAVTNQIRNEAMNRIHAFNDIWSVGLIVFGLYLIVLARLAHRSGFVPKFVSVLLGIAGFGYLFDSFTALVVRVSDTPLSSVSALGEVVFALWLVIRGRRIARHS